MVKHNFFQNGNFSVFWLGFDLGFWEFGVFPEQTSPLNRFLVTVLCAQDSFGLGGETDMEVAATPCLSYWSKVVFDRLDLTQLEVLLRTSLKLLCWRTFVR